VGAPEIRELFDYLRRLAPAFFAARMRGASDRDLARLEQAAGLPLSLSHRAFLGLVGATPATALNPFLNDRDYAVATLLAAYGNLEGERLPHGVVYFSASAILGETIFLRQGADPGEEPEIGDLRFAEGQVQIEQAEFVPKTHLTLQSWLRWFAFEFRMGQLEHALHFAPPWNPGTERREGNPEATRAALADLGLRVLWSLRSGLTCFDRGDLVASVYDEGSGRIAGDDLGELEAIAARLQALGPLAVEPVLPAMRPHSPRE
jgi:hypothetical protein